ncbi:MAG TPA: hypothetical protein VKX39_13060 [Bryobacteraceae bacterium]|nr:hypothetical protein [Bryobacteraceae bacterium]
MAGEDLIAEDYPRREGVDEGTEARRVNHAASGREVPKAFFAPKIQRSRFD